MNNNVIDNNLTCGSVICLAFCTSDEFANHCAVCITSVLENNKDSKVIVYVLTCGLSNKNKGKFDYLAKYYGQIINITLVNEKELDGLPGSNRRYSNMTWLRLLLPKILDVDKVLYLDSDTIVRHSLKEMFDTDLTNYACGAVEDGTNDRVEHHNRLRRRGALFNAGVLLMNLNFWRENDISEKVIGCAKEKGESLIFLDQDVLNIILNDEILFLPYKYNFQYEMTLGTKSGLMFYKWDECVEAGKDPVIIHYCTVSKPWHIDCVNPMKGEYDKYMLIHDVLREKKTYTYSRFRRIRKWLERYVFKHKIMFERIY